MDCFSQPKVENAAVAAVMTPDDLAFEAFLSQMRQQRSAITAVQGEVRAHNLMLTSICHLYHAESKICRAASPLELEQLANKYLRPLLGDRPRLFDRIREALKQAILRGSVIDTESDGVVPTEGACPCPAVDLECSCSPLRPLSLHDTSLLRGLLDGSCQFDPVCILRMMLEYEQKSEPQSRQLVPTTHPHLIGILLSSAYRNGHLESLKLLTSSCQDWIMQMGESRKRDLFIQHGIELFSNDCNSDATKLIAFWEALFSTEPRPSLAASERAQVFLKHTRDQANFYSASSSSITGGLMALIEFLQRSDSDPAPPTSRLSA